jgi:DNA-binding CsgD family transcriptional regulator
VTEFALLGARAQLRLGRAGDALEQLRQLDADDEPAIGMLIGAAQTGVGEHAAALWTLRAIVRDRRADQRVLAETQLWIALACYCARDLDAADEALDAVPADGDALHVRSLEYRGWLASARGDYDRAVAAFARALEVLDGCSERDRFVEANCVQALSTFAVERFDRVAWTVVAQRRKTGDWRAEGLAHLRFMTALRVAAFAYDVEGDVRTAAFEARRAEELAPSTAYRVEALCSRAWISRCAGERLAHRDHVETALRVFDGIGTWAPKGDEAIVPLILAEELANAGHQANARRIFAMYRSHLATSPMLAITEDRRRDGYERLVEAQILEAEEKVREAISGYRDAFRIFCPIGYVRRSIVAAVRLIRLSPGEDYLWGHIDAVVARLPKTSWIGPAADQLRRARQLAELTALQREHLRLVCSGMSNLEIARLRKRSKHTVRNNMVALYETFGVRSRAELVAECARLGIVTSASM